MQTKGVYIIGDMHLAGFANIDKRVRYKVINVYVYDVNLYDSLSLTQYHQLTSPPTHISIQCA